MKNDPKAKLVDGTKAAKPLNQVLKENEQVKDMLEESADELGSVNRVMNEEYANQDLPPEMSNALDKSEAVEIKVQEAADKLSVVNQALKDEVRERHLLERQLVTNREQQEESLHIALHDSLTGLPTRVLFNDRLEHGLVQATRHGWTLAVMFMDLDNFKTINDSYGHDVGDAVLRIVAERLKKNTRGDDSVSRHGGDEFLYLLTHMKDEQDATIIVEKIIKAIQVPCQVSIGELIINPSVGISIFPRDGTTAEALTKNADTAMYQAKRSKSGYVFAGGTPTQSL